MTPPTTSAQAIQQTIAWINQRMAHAGDAAQNFMVSAPDYKAALALCDAACTANDLTATREACRALMGFVGDRTRPSAQTLVQGVKDRVRETIS